MVFVRRKVNVRTNHLHFTPVEWVCMVDTYKRIGDTWYGELDPVYDHQSRASIDQSDQAFFIRDIEVVDNPEYRLLMCIDLISHTATGEKFRKAFMENPEGFTFIPRTIKERTEGGTRVRLYTVDAYTVQKEDI